MSDELATPSLFQAPRKGTADPLDHADVERASDSLALRRVINACGPATAFGNSRSDARVAQAAAEMLRRHVVLSDLQGLASQRLAAWSGAPAGCVTHCASAAITLAAAAAITGMSADAIARLPDARGLHRRVVMLAAQQVNDGQPMSQEVRLAGAEPVVCATLSQAATELGRHGAAAVIAVESPMAGGSGVEATHELRVLARHAGVPLVVVAGSQDWRVRELVATGADLVIFSAHRHLRAPTAGIAVGRPELVQALDAQHAGIGRGMKPTKEAIAGVLAALDLRMGADRGAWLAAEQRKVDAVVAAARRFGEVGIARVPDPQGNGFDRLWLRPDPAVAGADAATLIRLLRDGDPAVAVVPYRAAEGLIGLELTDLDEDDLPQLCDRLAMALGGALVHR